jgi:PadR family transcriptional regulator PadR
VAGREGERLPLTIDKSRAGMVLSIVEGSQNIGKPTDLVQGTLDLLILKTVALEPMHGWGIAVRIRQVSKEVLQVNQGALYPALHRLEQSGWIKARWGESDSNRRAKYYSLTAVGRKYLEQEEANWKRLSSAIGLVLEMR